MLLKRYGKVALVGGLATALVASMASVAFAAAPGPDGVTQFVTGAGSDTTSQMMEQIGRTYNVDNKTTKFNTDADNALYVPPEVNPDPVLGTNGFPSFVHVPADGLACPGIDYSTSNLPPNGSGAGLSQLNGANGANGCIDYARSSRSNNGSAAELADQFWAYATDAVGIVGFAATIHGKSDFSKDDLTKIYTCDIGTGLPFYTDWSQVPGTTSGGAIKRFAPQASSGTRAFFSSKMLNTPLDTNCTTPATQIEENDAAAIATTDHSNAVFFYSFGQFTAQTKSITPNLTNGAKLMKFAGVKPSPANIGETGVYGARRYVYNVTAPAVQPAGEYGAAIEFVGANTQGNGYICNNKALKTIAAYGFKALTKKADPKNNNVLSYCRLNPADL